MSASVSPPQGLSARNPFPEDCAERFTPIKQLGEGGFGLVYLATQKTLGRPVAVKLLLAGILEDQEQRTRFITEARITASVHHAGVVTVVDHGAARGVPWIVYEYLPGASLREHCGGAGMAPATALDIVCQVALAVQAAHDVGVLHRDLKPENILEAAPGRFKVTDFGIAKWTGNSMVKTATGIIVGTPAYLAPELIRGEPASPASDIYALGTVLFELLVGETPFGTARGLEVLELHLTGRVPSPSERKPGLPPELDDVVLRALARQPEKRHASAGELAARLRELSVAPTRPPRTYSRNESQRTRRVEPIPREGPVTVRYDSGRVLGLVLLAALSAVVWRSWTGSHREGTTAAPVISARTGSPSPPAPGPATEILDRIYQIRETSIRMNNGANTWTLRSLAAQFEEQPLGRLQELVTLTTRLCDGPHASVSRTTWIALRRDMRESVVRQLSGLDGVKDDLFIEMDKSETWRGTLLPGVARASGLVTDLARLISRVDSDDPASTYLRSSLAIHLGYWSERSASELAPGEVGYAKNALNKKSARERFVRRMMGTCEQVLNSNLSGRDWEDVYLDYNADLGQIRFFGGHDAKSPTQLKTCRLLTRGMAKLMATGDWKQVLARDQAQVYTWLSACAPILNAGSTEDVDALLPVLDEVLSNLPERFVPEASDLRQYYADLIDGLSTPDVSSRLSNRVRARIAVLRTTLQEKPDSASPGGGLVQELSSVVDRFHDRRLHYFERGAAYATEVLTTDTPSSLQADLDEARGDLNRLVFLLANRLTQGAGALALRRHRMTALAYRAALWIEIQVLMTHLSPPPDKKVVPIGSTKASVEGISCVGDYYRELELVTREALDQAPREGLSIAGMLRELKDLLDLFGWFRNNDQDARESYERLLKRLEERVAQDRSETGVLLASIIDDFWRESARGLKARDLHELRERSADHIRKLGSRVPSDRAALEALAIEIAPRPGTGKAGRPAATGTEGTAAPPSPATPR